MLKRLFSRRVAGEAAAEAVEPAPRRPGGINLGLLWFIASLFAFIAVGAAGLFAWREMESQIAAQHQLLLKAQGERLTAEMGARVQVLTDEVERIASQPSLAAVMAAGDPVAIAAQADAIAATLPGAVRVRLLPPGANQPDESVTPRLGYAALELARQAESGKRPGLEIHWPGAPDQYIALARPIAAPQQPVSGVILVAFDPRLLDRWLAASLPEGALAQVRQGGETPTILAARGDKGLGALPITGSAPLAGTQWEIAWWLPAMAPVSHQVQIDFLAPFLAAAGLLALLFFVLSSINNRLVRSDLRGLLTHVAGLMEHQREQISHVRLADFRQAVEALDESFLPPPPVAEPPQPPPHFATKTPAPSAVPENPLFLPQDTIQVEEVDEPGDKQ